MLRWLLERKFSLGLLAARNAAHAIIAPLRGAIERMKAAETGEDDPQAPDSAFHVAVLHASGNSFYVQFEEFIDTTLTISIQLTNQYKGASAANVADHERLLAAIEAGNPDKAHAAMHAIIQEVVSLITAARGRRARHVTQPARCAVAAARRSSQQNNARP